MDLGTINTWLGYVVLYLSIGLVFFAFFLFFRLRDQIRDSRLERKRQERDRNALASVGLVMKKKKPKKAINWKEIAKWSLGAPLASQLWPLFVIVILDDYVRSKFGKRAVNQLDTLACKPEHLRHQTTSALAEADALITDPLGFVPAKPFGHLHDGWKRFVAIGEAGDALWSFKIPGHPPYKPADLPWEQTVDAAEGYAWLRRGKVKAEFFTQWDSAD